MAPGTPCEDGEDQVRGGDEDMRKEERGVSRASNKSLQ